VAATDGDEKNLNMGEQLMQTIVFIKPLELFKKYTA